MIFQIAMAVLAFCFLCFVAFIFLVCKEDATGWTVEGGREPRAAVGPELSPPEHPADVELWDVRSALAIPDSGDRPSSGVHASLSRSQHLNLSDALRQEHSRRCTERD